jgi:hypothetical protein
MRSAARRVRSAPSRKRLLMSSAAALGVSARTSAAKSQSVKSISCPTAEMIGTGQAATARTSGSSLKAHRSSRLPPPRPITSRSKSAALLRESQHLHHLGRRALALDPGRQHDEPPAPAAPREDAHEILHRRAGGRGDETHVRGRAGSGCFRSGAKSPSAASRALSASNSRCSRPTPSSTMRRTIS